MGHLGYAIVAVVVVMVSLSAPYIEAVTCRSPCHTDSDCQADITNQCTFCLAGNCTTMCGVGCRSNADCIGGTNPCILCNERRVCSNPVPKCGSFCGGVDSACRLNGTGACAGVDKTCCTCHPLDINKGCGNWDTQCNDPCTTNSDCVSKRGNCTVCYQNRCKQPAKCGQICQSSSECVTNPSCSQCVGFFCSPAQSCGQVCISSAQCTSNPGNCKACIGAICSNYKPCGGSCGGDDWCPPNCPVCNRVAQCATKWSLDGDEDFQPIKIV